MLKPTPNIIHLNDAVLDVAAAHAPGGFVKDIRSASVGTNIADENHA